MATADGRQLFNVKNRDEMVYRDMALDLLGSYQSKNIITALVALETLQQQGWNIPETALRYGLANVVASTGLMGR